MSALRLAPASAIAVVASLALSVRTVASASSCTFQWPWSNPQTFAFPALMSVFNVKNASLPNGGARGDGVTDDWLAIQTAFNESAGYQTTFFPAGVYLVSKPLTFPRNHVGVTSRHIVHGENVLTTCIRAMDASAAFAGAAVVRLGEGVAQNFFNHIFSITISIGSRNPSAVGVQFDANNMGSMRNVSIVSEDGRGAFGLDMQYSDQIGPLLIKWLHVSGFATGVATATNVDSETLEHIWLTNQTVAGFSNTGQVVSIRDLTVDVRQPTCVPVLQSSGEANDAFLTLIQSTLINSIPDTVLPVAIIINSSMLHARDVSTSGFNYSLVYNGAVPPSPPPPPPTTCANTTFLNETAGNSPQITQYEGVSSEDCCIKCLEAHGVGGAPGPCMAWTFVAGASNATNMCWLHNGTSTYPRQGTLTGIVNVSAPVYMPPAPGSADANLTTPFISEWVSHPVVKLWDDGTTPDASLNLTISETPEPPLPAPAMWTNGLGTPINGSFYNCTTHEINVNGSRSWAPDCSPLFDAAMRAPDVTTIFFPPKEGYPGTWFFNTNVSIPRTVSRVYGAGAQLNGPASWLVADGDANDPPLIFERVTGTYGALLTIVHASRRPLVLRDVEGVNFVADCSASGGLGDVYVDDAVIGPINFCGGQRAWARQLNTEDTVTDVVVSGGASLWVLGYKTERGDGGLINVTDGSLEVLGTFAYSTDNTPKTTPLFAVVNSSASVSLREYNANCNPFQSLASETRAGELRVLTRNFSVPGLVPGHFNSGCTNDTRSSGFTLLNAYRAQ